MAEKKHRVSKTRSRARQRSSSGSRGEPKSNSGDKPIADDVFAPPALTKESSGQHGALRHIVLKHTAVKVVVTASAVMFVASAIAMFLLENPPIQSSGRIRAFESVEFSYATTQPEGISPVCGCASEQKPEKWRGVTFVARDVELENRAKSTPLTGYFITSPAPSLIDWTPAFKYRVTVYTFALPRKAQFDPRSFQQGGLPKGATVKQTRAFNVRALWVMSESKLEIALLGEFPIGAWIPVQNSKVTIGRHRGMFPNAPSSIVVKEEYDDNSSVVFRPSEEGTEVVGPLSYPMIDLIGPQVAIWSRSPVIVLRTKEGSLDPGPALGPDEELLRAHPDEQTISAILIDVPFSVRIAAVPFGAVDESPRDSRRSPEIPRRFIDSAEQPMIRRPQTTLSDAKMGRVVPIADPRGEAELALDDTALGSFEYDRIYRSISQADSFPRHVESTLSNKPEDWVMLFRMPPLPRHNGLNIFGRPASLTFNGAYGSLAIGGSSMEINSPSKIEFRDTQNIRTSDGVIPVVLGRTDTKADVSFQGKIRIFVNGVAATTRVNQHKDELVLLSFILAVISAIGAVLALRHRGK